MDINNKNIKGKIIKNPFFISFLFLIFGIVFLAIFFNKISRDNLTEQIQHRQQLASRVGSRAVGIFLRAVGRNTATLAGDPTKERLNRFVANWGNDGVAGVIVANKYGIVVDGTNRAGVETMREDISEREYFKWAKTAKDGEFLISPPVISIVGETKGKYIIPISSPIFDENNQFAGVVTSANLLSEIVANYLKEIKVLESSNVYLLTSEGEIIYSDVESLNGQNFKDIFAVDFLGKEKLMEIIDSELKKNDETKIQLATPNFSNNYKLEPYLVTASPVNLNNDTLWKVVISVPQKI